MKIHISVFKDIKAAFLVLIIPFAIFILHSLLFKNWIIDDAGISFAYARNLASGYGLVSQPGNIPVEGYSNPLWVLILSLLFYLRIFLIPLTPKILSLILILGTFIIIYKAMVEFFHMKKFLVCIALCFISVNTSFVVWSISGLENPLYVFLVCLLFYQLLKFFSKDEKRIKDVSGLAFINFFISITRPEGVLYFFIYPLLTILFIFIHKRFIPSLSWRVETKRFLFYSFLGGALLGLLTLFRWFYFNDIFPNTYYAKHANYFFKMVEILTFGPGIRNLTAPLFVSIIGRFSLNIFIGIIIMLLYLLRVKKLNRSHLILFIFLIWPLFVYLMLPNDWMGEFRFATPFFVFFYLFIITLIDIFLRNINKNVNFSKSFIIVILFFYLILSSISFHQRSIVFARNPTVPFEEVANSYGHKFNKIADYLNLRNASFLVSDIGGTLFYSKLKIYDMAGLCEGQCFS